MKTLLLDNQAWDLLLDLNGNIALASEPYAQAQDAASAIKLFRGELWYDTTKGVRYGAILGKSPPLRLVKAYLERAALTVPGVAKAVCTISELARVLSGTVTVTNDQNQTVKVGF